MLILSFTSFLNIIYPENSWNWLTLKLKLFASLIECSQEALPSPRFPVLCQCHLLFRHRNRELRIDTRRRIFLFLFIAHKHKTHVPSLIWSLPRSLLYKQTSGGRAEKTRRVNENCAYEFHESSNTAASSRFALRPNTYTHTVSCAELESLVSIRSNNKNSRLWADMCTGLLVLVSDRISAQSGRQSGRFSEARCAHNRKASCRTDLKDCEWTRSGCTCSLNHNHVSQPL